MEQTFNRDSKTKGGIVGFTLNRTAVRRWILAQPERGSITRQCYVVAGHREEKRLMFVYYEQVYLFSLFSVQLKNAFLVTNHASTFPKRALLNPPFCGEKIFTEKG